MKNQNYYLRILDPLSDYSMHFEDSDIQVEDSYRDCCILVLVTIYIMNIQTKYTSLQKCINFLILSLIVHSSEANK